MKKPLSLIGLAAFIAGCSTILPLEPKYDELTLIAQGKDGPINLSLENSRALLSGWRVTLDDAANDRQIGILTASEVLFYGTVATVVGATIPAIGLRNTGAALAGGSTLFSSHYQEKTQQAAFRKAATRVQCGELAIAPITPDGRDTLFSAAEIAAMMPALNSLPRQTRDFIAQTRSDLRAALQAIDLSPPTQEQLQSAFKNLTSAQADGAAKAGAAAPTPAANANKKAQDIADERVKLGILAAPVTVTPKSQTQVDLEKAAFTVALTAYPQALDACLKANPQ